MKVRVGRKKRKECKIRRREGDKEEEVEGDEWEGRGK